MPAISDTIECYRVESARDEATFQVRHVTSGTVHTLRLLSSSAPSDRPMLLARSRLLVGLNHPNVVRVTDVLVVDDVPAQVRENVAAPTLAQWLDTHGAVPDALALFRGVVTAVGVAHGIGVVHGTLGPSNVLVERGRAGGLIARVTDFGLVSEEGSADLRALGRVLAALVPEPTDDLRRVLDELAADRVPSCADLWTRLWPDPVPAPMRAPILEGSSLDAPIPFAALARNGVVPATGGLDVPPTLVPAEEPPAAVLREGHFVPLRMARPMWMWPAALGVAVAVALPVVLVVLLGFGGSDPRPSTVDRPSIAASLPAPVEPVASVTPPPPPRPTPPTRIARTAPTAPTAPKAETGTVVVEGDAKGVWLERGGKRIEARGSVTPGSYVVRAAFRDGSRRRAGEIVVRPGVETRVRCASFAYACTEVTR